MFTNKNREDINTFVCAVSLYVAETPKSRTIDPISHKTFWQRGRVVRAPDLKSGGRGLKSRSDHLAGVVSRWTLVQLLGHACR